MANAKIILNKTQGFWNRHKIQVAATALAVLTWFLVINGDTFDHNFTIPIQMQKDSDDYIVKNQLPKTARVNMRGRGWNLIALGLFKRARLEFQVPMKTGTQIFIPTSDNVVLSGWATDISVREILSPDTLYVTLERAITKKVPIKLAIQIKTVPGYTLEDSVRIDPPFVQVYGPRSLVDTLSFIATEKGIWNGLNKPFKREIRLVQPFEQLLEMRADRAAVSGDVQKLLEKKLTAIPVKVINLPPDTKAIVIPAQLSLTIQGGFNRVLPVTEKAIEAYIDYHRYIRLKETEIAAYIQPLPGIRFMNVQPQKFKLVLEKRNNSK